MPENNISLEIAACLYVKDSSDVEKGRGVFTSQLIAADCVIEVSPVLVMSQEDRALLDKTPLYNYIFVWNPELKMCCAAWGYISLYNHSYTANCEYFMDYDLNIISIKTVREIQAGEELTINYNGDWDDHTPIWFDAR